MVILVASDGSVESQIYNLPNNIDGESLEAVIRLINDKLVGSSLSEVTSKLQELQPLLTKYIEKSDGFIDVFGGILDKAIKEQFYIGGRRNLLNFANGNNLEQIKSLYSLIDDERWFRRFSTAKDQEYVTIRSTGKQAGNWPLMIGVGEMVIMFNCMTSSLRPSLSTYRNCWKALVQPDTQIISNVQAMIEGNDHILVRVFLSSEWNNGYSGFVRSMDRQYEISGVGTA